MYLVRVIILRFRFRLEIFRFVVNNDKNVCVVAPI